METETFKNNIKNKFPIYVHLLRVFSTKNELEFQGKTKTYTSNLIEKLLLEKIRKKPKKIFINNISWVGLLINNALTISNKFIPKKIIYLYNYLCKISEIQFIPSLEFEPKYKNILGRLIDLILDYCFNNNIEDIFNLKITNLEDDKKYDKIKSSSKKLPKKLGEISKDQMESKELFDLVKDIEEVKTEKSMDKIKKDIEEEEKLKEKMNEDIEESFLTMEEINIIHYFVHLNEIVVEQLEEKEKKGYSIFDKKLRQISIEIEPYKNKLNLIYDKLIKSLIDEIKKEKETRQIKEIEKINYTISNECEELEDDKNSYISKYEKIQEELPKEMFNKNVLDL